MLVFALMTACDKVDEPLEKDKKQEQTNPDKKQEEDTNKDKSKEEPKEEKQEKQEQKDKPEENKPEQEGKKIKSSLMTKWDVSGTKQRFIEQTKEVFDKQGRIVESIKYHNRGKVRERMVYKFDERGLNHESELYNQNGTLQYRFKMSYNEQGKLIEKKWLYPDNTIYLTNTLTYKADGKVIDELASAKYIDETKEYTYNDKGLMIKLAYLYKNEPTDKDYYVNGIELYEYNDKGLMTLKAIYRGADETDATKLEEKKVWKYNEQSILEAYELYGANEEVRVKITYTSEVDEEGNWTKLSGQAEGWANNSPTLVEREIEYFD